MCIFYINTTDQTIKQVLVMHWMGFSVYNLSLHPSSGALVPLWLTDSRKVTEFIRFCSGSRSSQVQPWPDHPGSDSFQPHMWSPSWGCVHVPAASGSAQLRLPRCRGCKYLTQIPSFKLCLLLICLVLYRVLLGDVSKLLCCVHVWQAVRLQEKAVMISERIQGIDHPQTIEDYVSHRS